MKKYIVITGDMNDGDYIERVSVLKEEHEALFKKLAVALKNKKDDYSWPVYEGHDESIYDLYVKTGFLTEEEIDEILDTAYIPYAEHGIHSITNMYILDVEKKETLL